MLTTLYNVGFFIHGLYSFILILTGTPLNFLCFYIFKRIIPNRSNATIIVFSYLAIIELLIPFTWTLNYAIRELIWKNQKHIIMSNLEEHSLFVCKIVSYSAYFLLQCAAWLKTLATIARCISLHNEWPIRKYFIKPITTHYLSWLTIFLIGLINSPILIINRKRVNLTDKYNHTHIEIKCYQSKFFQFWEIAHLLLYNFIPFTLMILCNISIIRHVHQSQRRTKRSKTRSKSSVKQTSISSPFTRRSMSASGGRLSKTLIFITIFFILFTSPSAMFYIFFGKRIEKPLRTFITMGLSNLATTSHVVSFIIYWLTSTDFQEAVVNFIYCRPLVSYKHTIEEKPFDKRTSMQSPVRTSLNPEIQPSSTLLQRSSSCQ